MNRFQKKFALEKTFITHFFPIAKVSNGMLNIRFAK